MDPQEDIYNTLEYKVKSVRIHNVNGVANVVHILSLKIVKQECIPVGCVPPAAVAVPLATHASHPPPCMPPFATHVAPVDRQTDTCENITFANFVCLR